MEWRPPENESDVSRLNKLVTYYESVNLDQIQQISNLKQTQEANVKTILEYEKNKKILTKTIKSLEGRMKFDKIAADGTKKKFNLLEYEVREIKHTNDQMSAERSDDKTMISQLREDLNSNRSDKLKFMHENAILKKQSAALAANESSASADAVFARSDLLDKLQTLDNVMVENETLRRTVSAQSEEMLTLSHEQHDLNEKLFAANKQVVNLELMTAEYNRTIDILQHEISRLRKELASSSHSFNVKSTALLSRSGASNPANRISTDITHSSYGQEVDGPYSLTRRPHTQQGLSRERNQLASNGASAMGAASRGSSRSQQRLSPGDSTQLQIGAGGHSVELPHLDGFEKSSKSRGAIGDYGYVDLSSHLQRPPGSSGSAVLVAGGSIGTNGNTINKTVRVHLLQDYSDVIVAAAVSPSLRHNACSATPTEGTVSAAGIGHSSSGSVSGDLTSAIRGYSAMCSPVSTPFRRPPSQASPPPKPRPGSQHAQKDSAPWFQEELTQTKGELLSNINMPSASKASGNGKAGQAARASTAARRQEGVQRHSRRLAEEELGLQDLSRTTSGIGGSCFSDLRGAEELEAWVGERPDAGSFTDSVASPARVSFQPTDSGTVALSRSNAYAAGVVKSARSKLPPPETNNKKSMFVGAGLGLKHNQELDAELRNLNKGSTHQILKKILGDRFD